MIRCELSDNKCDARDDGGDETSVSGREGIRGELENDMPLHNLQQRSSSVSLYSNQHKLLNRTFQTTLSNKKANMDTDYLTFSVSSQLCSNSDIRMVNFFRV
jgi:hypothetical protein